MFSAISMNTISNAQVNSSEPPDSSKYVLTKDQLVKTKIIIEENKALKFENHSLKKIDSLRQKEVDLNKSVVFNVKRELELKELQIRQLEAVPKTVVVVDSREWYELPVAIVVGFAAGYLTNLLIK